MNFIFPFYKIAMSIGIFILYFVLTKKIINNYGKARAGLFTVFYISSAIINFLFSYFIGG